LARAAQFLGHAHLWFALDETRPLACFAGGWTNWTSRPEGQGRPDHQRSRSSRRSRPPRSAPSIRRRRLWSWQRLTGSRPGLRRLRKRPWIRGGRFRTGRWKFWREVSRKTRPSRRGDAVCSSG